MDFMHRLRELDYEVEQLRSALAALQRHLVLRHPSPAAGNRPAREGEDFLRAYV